jgi:hypothetical protein
MSTTLAARRRHRIPGLAKVTLTIAREWYPTREAAAMIGVSERTLRRRLEKPFWLEGRHYRWTVRTTRRTLEINVPAAIKLMDRWGWG